MKTHRIANFFLSKEYFSCIEKIIEDLKKISKENSENFIYHCKTKKDYDIGGTLIHNIIFEKIIFPEGKRTLSFFVHKTPSGFSSDGYFIYESWNNIRLFSKKIKIIVGDKDYKYATVNQIYDDLDLGHQLRAIILPFREKYFNGKTAI